MKRKRFVLACVAALLLTSCGNAAATSSVTRAPNSSSAHATAARPGLWRYTVRSGGRTRTYLLYVPHGYTAKHPLPLVLVFHGITDTALGTTTMNDLLAVDKRRNNMLLAYMQGYENSWNDTAGHTPAEVAHVNDVAFTVAALRQIESVYAVDRRRVVDTGFSNGALASELFGCRIAAYLTLLVPVEGQMPTSVSPGCRPAAPISVFEIHGTADQVIPYDGGTFTAYGGSTTVLAAPASAARWATLDGCRSTIATVTTSTATISGYTRCRGGVSVELESIQGGDHQWPDAFGELIETLIAKMPTSRVAAGTTPPASVTRR